MIDHLIGAQFARFRHFLLAAGRGDHAALKKLGHLDGRRSHAARGRQHQHVLAGLQLRARHQHVPCGQEHQRHGGGLFEAQRVRNLDGAVFGRGEMSPFKRA